MIIRVTNKQELQEFLALEEELYRGDASWVPTMLGADSFNSTAAPVLRSLDWELYIYKTAGKVQGRIAVFLSYEFNEIHAQDAVFFGLFECIKDQGVADALLGQVEAYARQKNKSTILGPIDFNTNYTVGLLVDGFTKPSVMTRYNKPYYASLMEAWGFTKFMDLYAYTYKKEQGIPDRLTKMAALISRRYPQITVRSLSRRPSDVTAIRDVYNTAFTSNWGYVPMSLGEIRHLVNYIWQKGDPELVHIAYDRRKPVGVALTLPDPKNPGLMRLSLLGVDPDYRGKGLETILICRNMACAFYQKGCQVLEFSVVLENNNPMNRFISREGECLKSKVYRVYGKQIAK